MVEFFFGKTVFSRRLEKENMIFRAVNKITFRTCYFLSSSKVSVAFNVLSSCSNTNLPIRCFPQIHQFCMLYYIHNYKCYHSTSNYFYRNPNHLILYTHTKHSFWLDFCFELHTLSFNLHLHSHNSFWTKYLFHLLPTLN